MNFISAHLFYAYFTHGPNTSTSAQYDNTRGAWLTQEGCTITERKQEGTLVFLAVQYLLIILRINHAHCFVCFCVSVI